MTQGRTIALFGASLLTLAATSAFARQASQDEPAAPTPATADAEDAGDDIVVTGTRTAGRTRLDSASPVDVLSGASLQRQGTTELATALATVAPSINFPRPSANDATDAIRPATLRGLAPD